MRNTANKIPGFGGLDKNVLGLIFSFIPTQALHRSTQVSKRWNQAVAEFEGRNETRFKNQFPEIHAIIQSHQHKVKDWREELYWVTKFANYFPYSFKNIKTRKTLIRNWQERFNRAMEGIHYEYEIENRNQNDWEDFWNFYITIAEANVEELHKIIEAKETQVDAWLNDTFLNYSEEL